MESIGSLTAGIAHNLNNFLQPIGTCSQLLLKKHNPEAVKIIIKSCARASNLVDNLMAYSRQDPEEKTIQSIHSILDETLSLVLRSVPSTAMIHINLGEDPGNVLLNKGQIQTSLINLISNAVDSLDGGKGHVKIIMSSKNLDKKSINGSQSFVYITVADTGSGMNAETRERIFDPFFTTKKVGEGTGLGLSTVYGTVMDHGGAITCSSSIGKGTTFEIKLPLVVEQTANTVEER